MEAFGEKGIPSGFISAIPAASFIHQICNDQESRDGKVLLHHLCIKKAMNSNRLAEVN